MAIKKTVTKRVSKKKVTAKAAPKKRGRPAKKATIKRRGRPADAKKVATEEVASVKEAAPVKSESRRGRPVSADSLQRKLAVVQTALKSEKEKRQKQAAAARAKIAALTADKRKLGETLAQVRKTLSEIEAEKRAAEKEAQREQKMEIARAAAVTKFLEKWEKSNAAKPAKGKMRKKRGRPRAS